MGDENPIHTLGDYSIPSHEGYRNTIELPDGNNVVPLRAIRLVQNGCSFHRLRSEDPNQHLKDFQKLVDSLDLDVANRKRRACVYFNFPIAIKLAVGLNVYPWDPSPLGRISLIGESLSETWTRFKDLLQKVPHHDIDLWLQVQIFYDHVNPATRRTINQLAKGKLQDKNAEESWALLEDLALYDNESWNDPKDFAKPVKAISLPQDVLSTSDPRLIELKNQVQCLIEAHLDPKSSIQITKIKELEQTLEDEFKDLHPNLLVLEVIAHAPMYNANLDKYVESLELGKNGSAFIQGEMPKKIKDPGLFTLPCRLGDSKPFDTLADLGSCVNLIPLYLFKKLKIGLLEETDHVFGLANETNSYAVGIVKNVEFHIGRLKLLEDFYVIDIEKNPATPLLVGRGFLATASAMIDCKKAKIAVGDGVTRSVFGVKEIDLRGKEVPYWTTLGKIESYGPRPSTDGIGAQPPFYARKDLDYHLPREWKIARDAELNPFKDILVFRNMVEFLGALPINLKGNMWESEELIKEKID
ncbi:MAK10-like protein [Tanacetum coccineum]